MDHLRYSGLDFETQRAAFIDIVLADPLISETLTRACALDLPDWLLVSGALYNSVWNHLTMQPTGHGTKDVDLFYFDASDLSYEAEDAVIRKAAIAFEGLVPPIEARNQARVHLWYEARFGGTYPALSSSAEALSYFASKTHAVGVRFGGDGKLDVVAPFGLDDIFSFRITPNRVLDNRRTHETKGARSKRAWPQVDFVPW
jgi:hypothetical protein